MTRVESEICIVAGPEPRVASGWLLQERIKKVTSGSEALETGSPCIREIEPSWRKAPELCEEKS